MTEVQETPQETQTAETQTETVETAAAESAEVATTESPETPEQPEEGTPETPQETVVTEKKWKIKRGEEEIELDERGLLEHAQKGFDYTKKTQALADIDKNTQQRLQMADAILNNAEALKVWFARQAGFDPVMVLTEPQAPNEQYRETNPEWYGAAMERYNFHKEQKARFQSSIEFMTQENARSTNHALFERARIQSELSEPELQQVAQFVSENMKPNQMGTYSERQITAAVKAVVGEQRSAQDKLKTANDIQNKVRKAAQTPAPKVSQKKDELPPDVEEARAFKEYVKRFS